VTSPLYSTLAIAALAYSGPESYKQGFLGYDSRGCQAQGMDQTWVKCLMEERYSYFTKAL